MSSNHNDPVRIRQYLLGQLTGRTLDEFEQRLFTDDEFFDEVLATEDELIESSIAQELAEDEAEWFARYFLITPEREQKLRFRQTLQRVVKADKREPVYTPQPSPGVPWLPSNWISWATACVAAFIIIGVVVWIAQMSPGSTVAELTLTAGSSERAVGRVAPSIKFPLKSERLKLHLTLAQPAIPAKDYRVEMLTYDGRIKTLAPISHNDQLVDVMVPAAELSRGQYAFNVYAIKTDGTEQRLPGSYLLTID
ncbi:MAG TPA: hypothetical protein VGW76_01055 [Pyrinomonadaceae bacterium]|nr:hypothetical protein [Pyrinomonadaceae bacterium]